MPRLYEKDQEKVNRYLALPQNQTERGSFKPMRLLLILLIVLALLTLISYLIADIQGLI